MILLLLNYFRSRRLLKRVRKLKGTTLLPRRKRLNRNCPTRTAVMNTTSRFSVKTRPQPIMRTLVGCFILPSRNSLSTLLYQPFKFQKAVFVHSLKTCYPILSFKHQTVHMYTNPLPFGFKTLFGLVTKLVMT